MFTVTFPDVSYFFFFFSPCKRYILSRLVVDRFLRPISVSLCRRRWPLVSIRIRVQVSRCSLRRDHFESSSENKAGNGSVKRPFLFFFVSPRNAENGNRASFLISGRNANVSQLPVSTRVIRTRPEIKREYGLKIKAKENVIRSMNEMRCFEHHNAAYKKKKKQPLLHLFEKHLVAESVPGSLLPSSYRRLRCD